MTQKRYGRRFPSLETTEDATTTYTIECESSLIYRTICDRPANEDRLRGVC